VALALAGLAGPAGAAEQDLGLPPCAPYLQDGRLGQATVVWRNALPAPALVVVEALSGRRVSGVQVPAARQCEAVVTGLTPGQEYRYRVEQAGVVIGRGRFRANRGPQADHFRFAVVGDMGSGDRHQYAVAARMTAWRPEFVLGAGDIVYPGGEGPLFGPRFFEPYRALLANAFFYPALGNHDVKTAGGAPYLRAFSLPAEPGGERYYAFDEGPARFWALDSTQSLAPGSPQYEWLARDVAASRAPWKFAFFHHPLYSSGLHGSSYRLQRELGTFFSAHRFAAVFCGHDHDYERTAPIGGVTYFVSGGGGAGLYGLSAAAQPWSAAAAARYHFMAVSLYRDVLAGQAIDEDGRVIDAWVIRRR
jgi:hypothetical protein